MISSVGIIGYGHFGKFVKVLLERFTPDVQVKVYARRDTPDGKTFFSAAEVCACDAVVFCCPISAFADTLAELLPLIPKTTVIIDVATVKRHTVDILKRVAGDRPYLATHPMFGPESYKKADANVSGFRIVVADHTLPEEQYELVRSFVTRLGFLVIEMSADEHDQLLAETLFMTHYIGQTMQTAGYGRTAVDTVSFSSLMNAVEAVAGDGKLFLDVYHYNPYCEAAAVRFHEAQQVVLAGLLKKNK